jgi:hypothetical protein
MKRPERESLARQGGGYDGPLWAVKMRRRTKAEKEVLSPFTVLYSPVYVR